MKKIKLEVGKTYRNRKGELVGIVGKNSAGRPPYKGSDGEWYTEGGKWQYFGADFPEDLIEEVAETQHTFALVPEALTATRYTFTIPDGVKGVTVSQEGNRIIVEMVPEKEPKPGDVPESTRIWRWVEEHLNDGYYNQKGIADVIENYLKHKEGEK